MSSRSRGESVHDRNGQFRSLADAHRRQVLRVLDGRETGVEESELVRRLSEGAESTTSPDPYTIQVALRHVHLPMLEEAGFLEWDRSRERIVSRFDSAAAASLTAMVRPNLDDAWDELGPALAHRHRRAVLAITSARDRPIPVDALARQVVHSDDTHARRASVEQVHCALHHDHLPKLREASLIERTDRGVRYLGHPALDDDHLDGHRSDRPYPSPPVADVP